MTKKHELDWNKICESYSFTVPSRCYSRIHQQENKTNSIKLMPQAVSQIFSFPVIKRTTEQSRLIWILGISGILALNMWCHRPESTFKVLYYPVCKNFGRFYVRTLFLSEIKIVRNFLSNVLAKYQHLVAIWGWYISCVMLQWLHTNPSYFVSMLIFGK